MLDNTLIGGIGPIGTKVNAVGLSQGLIERNIASRGNGDDITLGGNPGSENFHYGNMTREEIFERSETYYGYQFKTGLPQEVYQMGARQLVETLEADYGPPEPLSKHMWSVRSDNHGEIRIEIEAFPHGADFNFLQFQYRLDGGEWMPLEVNFPFDFTGVVSDVSSGEHQIEIRSAVDGMVSARSDRKNLLVR